MKISVIITAFNAAKFLPHAIDSFLEQNYDDKELVIIDGISTDSTHEIIASYQKRFPHFIKWIQEKDSGISNARNIALKHVTGDLVGFLGADDLFHKNFFTEMAYYTKVNPMFDVIYFNSYCIGFSNSFDASAAIPMTKRNLIKHCPIGSGESFYYRREIFDSVKFNEKNRYSMDYELNMELVSSKKPNGKKYSFYPVNISSVFNVNTGENISSAASEKQKMETIAIQLRYAKCGIGKLKIILKRWKFVMKNFAEIKKYSANLYK